MSQLPLLVRVLALEPRRVSVQYAPSPQLALGTHRLWAADVLAVLLLAGNAAADAAIAAAGVLPAVVSLALSLDKASALHFRALQAVDCALRSREDRLWRALFEPGMGAGVTSAAAGGDGGDAPCAPLHEALAAIGAARAAWGGGMGFSCFWGVGVHWPRPRAAGWARVALPRTDMAAGPAVAGLPTHAQAHATAPLTGASGMPLPFTLPPPSPSSPQPRPAWASPWASAPDAQALRRAWRTYCSPRQGRRPGTDAATAAARALPGTAAAAAVAAAVAAVSQRALWPPLRLRWTLLGRLQSRRRWVAAVAPGVRRSRRAAPCRPCGLSRRGSCAAHVRRASRQPATTAGATQRAVAAAAAPSSAATSCLRCCQTWAASRCSMRPVSGRRAVRRQRLPLVAPHPPSRGLDPLTAAAFVPEPPSFVEAHTEVGATPRPSAIPLASAWEAPVL